MTHLTDSFYSYRKYLTARFLPVTTIRNDLKILRRTTAAEAKLISIAY